MRLLYPSVLVAGMAVLGCATGASADVLISVDEHAQTMSVAVDGVPTYHWKVSTGRSGYDTPTGAFQPFRMERDHFSKEWDDAPMPYSIFFTPEGHAIHGSLETRRLGRPVSHGCVRLDTRNAAILFALVAEQGLGNTHVIISGDSAGYVARGPAVDPSRLAPLPTPMMSASADADIVSGGLY